MAAASALDPILADYYLSPSLPTLASCVSARINIVAIRTSTTPKPRLSRVPIFQFLKDFKGQSPSIDELTRMVGHRHRQPSTASLSCQLSIHIEIDIGKDRSHLIPHWGYNL
ncbi:hypothetical protein ACTMU2_22280, partial [Cupriavidus basilensis]